MFSALSAYIKNIALFMLLAIFAEIIVPNDKIKKYVSVIVGLILIFAIVGKITDVVDAISKGDADITVFSYKNDYEENTENITDRLTGILYDEMSEVDSQNQNNDEFKVKVEKVLPYN
ncbi:MAG: stage III sporulation protein AF [Candidatus Metalachnospira sp.]|nr:stage III sporulation protein AF [Candidatus Metalachnospira sp.]